MADEIQAQSPQPKKGSDPARNPYIMNFCKVLIEKKSAAPPPEELKKLLDDMYRLFECMLGQNMIKALPEPIRQEYLAMTEDLASLTYENIGAVFDKNVPDYELVMKDTMKEFAAIFLKNKTFSPEHYPVPVEACTT
jgi:hypothetical protein